MTSPYFYSATKRVWAKVEPSEFQYSDGDELENYIHQTLINAKDVSTSSAEIIAAIKDWPSEYHLSYTRHNLLRPFSILPTQRILEIGSGCGGMTRYLGECGATVTAVEGSLRRAEIAAERCRDLPNVTVYCDNISDFRSTERYDVVTLIGVLEYAPLFIHGDDPVGECLRIARSFLNEGGVLILAIENQLGLKYFNGYAEDHLGQPFFGINDRYSVTTPITFGRFELLSRISSAGFAKTRTYYPFPDYKLPRIIFSPEVLDSPEINIADLLCMMESRDYSGDATRAFQENRVWPLLARNHLVNELANSFLVQAWDSIEDQHVTDMGAWMVASYATERLPAFATETIINSFENGEVTVYKRRLFENDTAPDSLPLSHYLANSKYHHGQLLIAKFQNLAAQDAPMGELARVLRPWVDLLRSSCSDLGYLSGDYLDCIPRNLIVEENGNIRFFDNEWHWNEPIPIKWVVVRGLWDCVASSFVSTAFRGLTVTQAVHDQMNLLGIDFNDGEFQAIQVLENRFQNSVTLRKNFSVLNMEQDDRMYLINQLQMVNSEILGIKSTYSWRLTEPFRAAWNLARHITQSIGIALKIL